jgi:hypothetical protein
MAWIERTLRDASLRDTARLLESFLNHELPQLLGEAPLQPGERFHSHQTRKVCTGVGPIQLRRAYYRADCGGRYPLDEALGLYDQYTPATVQLMCWAAAMDSSFELASETLARFAGLDIPGHQVQRVVNAFGQQAATWMNQRESDEISKPVKILNIQTDMTAFPRAPRNSKASKASSPTAPPRPSRLKSAASSRNQATPTAIRTSRPMHNGCDTEHSDVKAILQARAPSREPAVTSSLSAPNSPACGGPAAEPKTSWHSAVSSRATCSTPTATNGAKPPEPLLHQRICPTPNRSRQRRLLRTRARCAHAISKSVSARRWTTELRLAGERETPMLRREALSSETPGYASDVRKLSSCPALPRTWFLCAMYLAYSAMKILPGGRRSKFSGLSRKLSR